jgi:hypothetical protein
LWASSAPDAFFLREYTAAIAQEDGNEKDETVNEATSIVSFIRGKPHAHGIRINGSKKQQVIRKFEDEETKQHCVYGKFAQGASCIVGAGKCIIIATSSEAKGHQSAACNEIIHTMAKYLHKSEWPDAEEGSAAAILASAPPAGDWQAYVDKMLIGKGNVAKALIMSHEGETLGKSDGFSVSIVIILLRYVSCMFSFMQLKKYQADVAQEDGSDRTETIDEAKNLIQVRGF